MADLIFKHLIFFLVGVLQDIFITYYYQTISKGHPWRAGITSTFVTLINVVILYEILTGLENQILSIIIAYALGNGVGTFLIVKRDQIKKFFHKK